MTAQLLVDAQSRLGECALWCEQRRALYWTDIEASVLWRRDDVDGSIRQWPMPQRLGSFALTQEPSQLLLGLADGISLFNLDTAAMTSVVRVEAGNPKTRVNDGRCDAQGRFVFGTFNESRDGASGHFYRVDANLRVEMLPLPAASVANSICFSPDGKLMYFTDTPTRRIMCAEYHADGHIGAPTLFVEVPATEGFPDGSAVDADGGVWNAQWDGGCVVRYGADGVETDRLPLPASRPTCPAFGGAGFDRLFVTSARVRLDPERLRAQPHAGGVFELSPGRCGLPEHRFATRLRA